MKSVPIFLLFILAHTFGYASEIDRIVSFQVEVLNHDNLESIPIRSKVELGVQLPKSIAQKVKNFTENLAPDGINPFLEWELKVYALFTHVKTGTKLKVDGFYYREFTSHTVSDFPRPKNGFGYTDKEYEMLGGYEVLPSDYDFRVRFAPQMEGAWSFEVFIESESRSVNSEVGQFGVILNDSPNYLGIGQNGRFLSVGENSFYPAGCNLPWPQTSSAYDSEFNELLKAKWWSGRIGPRSEQYRKVKVLPRVYDKYLERFNLLCDSGLNMIRTIMYPSATEIEFEDLGNYTSRLPMAQEMDRILELAEERNVKLIWNLQIHYTYQYAKNAYGSSWTWDRKIEGKYNCYHELLGEKSSPVEFFTSEECKKYYKQRLRYLIARYGYSTSLGVFELFSEISNVGTEKADHSEFYQSDENWKIFRDWQVEMADFVNAEYNGGLHPITSSFAGEKHRDDDLYESESFGLMSSNIYSFSNPRFANFWIDKIAKRHLNEGEDSDCSYTGPVSKEHNIKPLIYSETDPVIIEAVCGDLSPEYSRFFWQGAFSGIAGAISWSLSAEEGDFSVFRKIDEFISGIDLDGEYWHPGASKMIERNSDTSGTYYSWEFNKGYAKRMDGIINPKGIKNKKRIRHADLMYLRSGDLDKAMGVITNKTYNVYLTDSNFRKMWDEKSDPEKTEKAGLWRMKPINDQRTLSTKNEKLAVMGMKRDKYKVEYFYPDSPNRVVMTEHLKGKKLKLNFPELLSDPSHYILLFKISPEN